MPTVPTKVSELENDAGYQTAEEVSALIPENLDKRLQDLEKAVGDLEDGNEVLF